MPDEQEGQQTNGVDTDNQSKWTFDIQRGLAWSIILVFLTVIVILAFKVVLAAAVDDAIDLLKLALGVLFNIVLLIVGYWFGSSKSSQTKDDTQNKIIDKIMPPAPQPPVDSGTVTATTTTTVEKKD